jgi:hypothetical protein
MKTTGRSLETISGLSADAPDIALTLAPKAAR